MQKYCILAILSTLRMTGYVHQMWYYQLVENFVFVCTKNQLYTSLHSWDIAKILQTSYFGTWLTMPTNIDSTTCRKFWYSSACKKNNFIPPFFLEALQRYCKLIILGTLSMPDCCKPVISGAFRIPGNAH